MVGRTVGIILCVILGLWLPLYTEGGNHEISFATIDAQFNELYSSNVTIGSTFTLEYHHNNSQVRTIFEL